MTPSRMDDSAALGARCCKKPANMRPAPRRKCSISSPNT